MMAEMSPKMISHKAYIGNKGLGFRSLINWATEISIVSGGVRCTFSREIAKNYWEEIKKGGNFVEKSSLLAVRHEDFASEQFGLSSPLPMLAVPKVEDCESGEFTTEIIVKYGESSLPSIMDQLDSLNGKVLLFLKNISCIDIVVDGRERTIRKEIIDMDDVTHITHVKIYDRKNPASQVWTLYQESDEFDEKSRYEISLAYNPVTHESGDVVYAFFPTRVPLTLPMAVHATFELSSSRNSINQSANNEKMQRLLAKAIMHFASLLAKNDVENPNWHFYDITVLKQQSEIKAFPIMVQELNEARSLASIYPTIGKGYLPLSETCRYGEALASFLDSQAIGLEQHLISGYSEREISTYYCDNTLREFAQKYSDHLLETAKEDMDLRAEFIAALAPVKGCKDLQLLVDENYDIIKKDARINVGESISDLPSEMEIRYVATSLVDSLKKHFDLSKEKNKERGVTARLKENGLADVSDMDFATVKRTIVTYSKSKMTLDGFQQLMFALYKKWKEADFDKSMSEVFEHPDFRVYNGDGKKCYPSETVLITSDSESIYATNFQLYGNLDFWCELFSHKLGEEQNAEDVRDFFLHFIGVESLIPKKYVPLDEKSYAYLVEHTSVFPNEPWNVDRFYSRQAGFFDHVNWFKIPDEDFFKELYENQEKSLIDILRLIQKDKGLLQSLSNRTLDYFRNNWKRAEATLSYPLYIMRSWDLLQPLKSYVVSEHISLTADSELERFLSDFTRDYESALLLKNLGAKETLKELESADLYEFLRLLSKKNLTKGVQPIYKAIREAIISNHRDYETFAELKSLSEAFAQDGMVYARQNGGPLTLQPVSNVYYWDNDRLPRQMLQSKWKLEIGNRIGENSVKAIFGVKLADELNIRILNNTPNPELESDVLANISQRFRYLLAYRFHNSRGLGESGQIKEAITLKNIKLRFYFDCAYSNENQMMQMSQGDMVTENANSGITFHICAPQRSYAEAIKSPAFCENLMEALCIAFKVTSTEMANSFRNTLKNSEEANSYEAHREIPEEEWEAVDKTIRAINGDKQALEELDLRQIIKERILEYRQAYRNSIVYAKYLALKADASIEDKALQLEKFCIDYDSEEIIDDFLKLESQTIEAEVVRERFLEMLNQKFGIESNLLKANDTKILPTLSPYLEILDKKGIDRSALSQHTLFMACFDGYEEKFCKELKRYQIEEDVNSYAADSAPNDFDPSSLIIHFDAVGINKASPRADSISHNSGKREGFVSEGNKVFAGRRAEKKVYEAMLAHPEKYADVQGHSKNLNPVNGQDHLHYDISYVPVEEGGKRRYLDVKDMTSEVFFMSRDEYEFACEHKSLYDIAIVRGDEIFFLLSPFDDKEGQPPLSGIADSYKFTITLSAEQK